MDPPDRGGPPGGRWVVGVEGVAGGELRGGGGFGWFGGSRAMVVLGRV